jgi:hypothetical protein
MVVSLPQSKPVVIPSYQYELHLRCPREPQARPPAENSHNAHGQCPRSPTASVIFLGSATLSFAGLDRHVKADPIKHEQTYCLKLDLQSFLSLIQPRCSKPCTQLPFQRQSRPSPPHATQEERWSIDGVSGSGFPNVQAVREARK